MFFSKGPDFVVVVVVGGQKCGTTSLYHYISHHPQVISAKTKEVHYFDLNFEKGDRWYNEQFPSPLEKIKRSIKIKKKVITGEASPYYMVLPFAIERMHSYNSHIKIIVLLRDPIERALSHFYHEKKLDMEKLSIEDAIKEEGVRTEGELKKMEHDTSYKSINYQHYTYLKRGEYAEQIKNLLTFFDKKNILLIQSEEFYRDTEKVMSKVYNFLNIDEVHCKYEVKNKSKYNKIISDKTREILRVFYKNRNKKLFELIGTKFDWQ